MDILVTMSAPPALVAGQPSIGHKTRELALSNDSGARQQQTISIRSPSMSTSTINDGGNATRAPVSPHMENATTTSIGGATVFIGAGIPDVVLHSSASDRIPEVQPENGSREADASAVYLPKQQNFIPQKPAHIVKIQIKPGCDKSTNTRVISEVSIHSEDVYTTCSETINGIDSVDNSVVVFANNSIINSKNNYVDFQNLRYTSSNKDSDIVNSKKNSNEPCVTINGKNSVCNYLKRDLPTEESLSCSCKINENTNNVDMVQQSNLPEALNASRTSNSSFCYSAPLSTTMISSGQCSPSETLDSGTCSDLDGTPPPLPKKKSSGTIIMGSGCKSSIDVHHLMNQRHDTTGSLTSSGAEVDSDDNESIISCDSLNSGDLPINGKIKFRISRGSEHKTAVQHRVYKDNEVESKSDFVEIDDITNSSMGSNKRLEDSLMTNIGEKHLNSDTKKPPSASPITSGTSNLSTTVSTPRIRSPEIPETLHSSTSCSTLTSTSVPIVNECTYEERKRKQECISNTAAMLADALVNSYCTINHVYEDDRFYKFHINERDEATNDTISKKQEKGVENDDECFAGYKIFEREAIRSAKGTVRGVKNRVRAGIATFLQRPSSKNYKAKDTGKVVVYTTTMGIVRETYYRCVLVKQILRTHMVKYEERDMYMSTEAQTELKDRIGCTAIEVPQLFINGQYIGDAHMVEQLNETGELRQLLKPYKSLDACTTCQACGGYRLLPCSVCNGSKKSVHRNHFTAEFIALKCMNCDEVGLVRCQYC